MDDVTFNEETAIVRRSTLRGKKGFAERLVELGYARTEKSANAILIVICIVLVGIAVAVPSLLGSKSELPPRSEIDANLRHGPAQR